MYFALRSKLYVLTDITWILFYCFGRIFLLSFIQNCFFYLSTFFIPISVFGDLIVCFNNRSLDHYWIWIAFDFIVGCLLIFVCLFERFIFGGHLVSFWTVFFVSHLRITKAFSPSLSFSSGTDLNGTVLQVSRLNVQVVMCLWNNRKPFVLFELVSFKRQH